MKCRLIFLLGVPLALAGCLSPREYDPILEYLLSPARPELVGTPTGATLGVRTLEHSESVGLDVTFVTPERIQLPIPNTRWAEAPEAVLSRMLVDSLRESGRFADVGDATLMARPKYMLTGELRRFHHDRTVEPWTVLVEADIVVRETFGTAVIATQTVSVRGPAPGDAPAEIVAAFDAALTEACRVLVEPLMTADFS